MAMDNAIKETDTKWNSEHDKGSFKNGNKYHKNGGAYSTANGNNCPEKESIFKTDIIECSEEIISCGLGPCHPKWLQVISAFPLSVSI